MSRFEWGVLALYALIWSACLIIWVTQVEAETGWDPRRMALHQGNDVCFELVSIENRSGPYHTVEILESQHGPVSIEYETVGAHNATDHDLINVVDLPPGVVANPMFIELPDDDTGYICLMEFSGM